MTENSSDARHPNPEEDTAFGSLNRLGGMLKDHDERGLVLSLAAFAEDALGKLLRAFMRPAQASADLLTGFNAPLGTFSSRIKACSALGLINDEQFKDLEYLRKIRNEFAHSWEHVSLAQDKLASFARNLTFSYLDECYPETSADKVRTSISALLTDISSMVNQIEVKGTGVKVTGSRLIPLFSGTHAEQVEHARARLERIKTQLADATGDRRRFCTHMLSLFETQAKLLVTLVPEEQKRKVMLMVIEAEQLSASIV